jgi:hypothetical protein
MPETHEVPELVHDPTALRDFIRGVDLEYRPGAEAIRSERVANVAAATFVDLAVP